MAPERVPPFRDGGENWPVVVEPIVFAAPVLRILIPNCCQFGTVHFDEAHLQHDLLFAPHFKGRRVDNVLGICAGDPQYVVLHGFAAGSSGNNDSALFRLNFHRLVRIRRSNVLPQAGNIHIRVDIHDAGTGRLIPHDQAAAACRLRGHNDLGRTDDGRIQHVRTAHHDPAQTGLSVEDDRPADLDMDRLRLRWPRRLRGLRFLRRHLRRNSGDRSRVCLLCCCRLRACRIHSDSEQ